MRGDCFSVKRVLIILFGLVLLVACGRKEKQTEHGLKIVTSFYPIYSMVKEVSGDLNDVRMIQSGNGIHSFEPSASDVAAIYDADAFIYHSHTLEAWAGDLDPSLQHSSVQVIEASDGMSLDRVKGLEDVPITDGVDEKTLYDPHTWLDPEKVAEEAHLIANALAKLDKEHKAIYLKNAEKFGKSAHKLTQTYDSRFKEYPQKTFVTQHTAFSYLAKRFDLTQLGIAGISPDQEPSPRQLSEIEDFVKTYHVKTIFVESNASTKIANTLVRATGAHLATLNPLEADPKNNKSYLENLEDDLKILSKELEKK